MYVYSAVGGFKRHQKVLFVTERARTLLKKDAEREEGGTPGIVESIR
jgi:hypothetical protein